MSKKKVTPFWPDVVLAVFSRDPSRLRALIKSGSDVNERDSDGRTGLHHAAIAGDIDMTSLLLNAKATGEMITLLLRYGADKAHKNKHDVSPADLANMIANYDVKRWLS